MKFTTSYTYDEAGNLLTKNDGSGITTYTYDNRNRLIEMEDALGQSETYTYDANSNVIGKTDRNGTVTTTVYDGLKRVVSVSAEYADGTPASEYLQNTYSKTGSLTQQQNESMTISYTYDNHGRNTAQYQSDGMQKLYTYNLDGARLSFQLKQGNTVETNQGYTYDAAGRLSQITGNGTIVASYTYDGNSRLLTTAYPSAGITSAYTYGTAGQLISLVNRKGTGILSQYGYTYYLDGNPAGKTDASGTTSYTYDGLGRLTQESNPAGTTLQYTYDAAGNRLTLTESGSQTANTAYMYDANNRLIKEMKTTGETVTVTGYAYDPNGNQISRIQTRYEEEDGSAEADVAISVLGEEETPYNLETRLNRYNSRNQLISVQDGGITATYTYGPDGLRLSKTVNGETTTHIWDGSELVAETCGSGMITQRYLRGNSLAASLDTDNQICY